MGCLKNPSVTDKFCPGFCPKINLNSTYKWTDNEKPPRDPRRLFFFKWQLIDKSVGLCSVLLEVGEGEIDDLCDLLVFAFDDMAVGPESVHADGMADHVLDGLLREN